MSEQQNPNPCNDRPKTVPKTQNPKLLQMLLSAIVVACPWLVAPFVYLVYVGRRFFDPPICLT